MQCSFSRIPFSAPSTSESEMLKRLLSPRKRLDSRPGQASSKVRGGISYFLCLLKKNSLKLSCNKTKAPYRHEPIYFPCHHFAAYFWPCTLGTGVKIGRGFFLYRYINISVCNTLFYIYYHILPELFRSSFFLNCAYNLGSSI